MPKTQSPNKVNPPTPADRDTLQDYTAVIQTSFDEVFQAAHDHIVLSNNPAVKDGSAQTVSIVDTGTNVYLVVKTSRGWFKSPSFTAI